MTWIKDPNINNGVFVLVEDANNAKYGRTRAQQGLTIQLAGQHPAGSTTLVLGIADAKFSIPTPGYSLKAIIDKGGTSQEIVQYTDYQVNTPAGKSTLTLANPTTVTHNDLVNVEEQNRYLNTNVQINVIYYNNSQIIGSGNNTKVYAESYLDFTEYARATGLVLRYNLINGATYCYTLRIDQTGGNKNFVIEKVFNSVIYTILSGFQPAISGKQMVRFRVDNSANPVLEVDIDGVPFLSTTDTVGTPITQDGYAGFRSGWTLSNLSAVERWAAGTWI